MRSYFMSWSCAKAGQSMSIGCERCEDEPKLSRNKPSVSANQTTNRPIFAHRLTTGLATISTGARDVSTDAIGKLSALSTQPTITTTSYI